MKAKQQIANEVYSIHTSAGYWVTRLARAMESDFEMRLVDHNVTRASWAVLSAIYHDDKNTPAALASFIGTDGAAITRQLDRIEKQGLVERDRSLSDRRSVNLKVTRKGARLIPKIVGDSDATNNKFLNGLNRSEIKQIVTITQKMLSNADDVPGNL